MKKLRDSRTLGAQRQPKKHKTPHSAYELRMMLWRENDNESELNKTSKSGYTAKLYCIKKPSRTR